MCSCDSTGPFFEIVSIMIVAVSSPCLVVPVFDVAIAVAAATTAVAVAVAIAAPATVGVTTRMGTTITRR